ncbi:MULTISPECIES: sensor histidine kinase [Reichenbachiella]|uniref:histidine kinase n=1 Tax=Reichenbachiella agariperforans TaxID=156994 RepID=A0A1M6P4U8_REIAG|nr:MULTISPECIES: HAMP domain-containing sensor histidine kinase [Reichenbachiella]MBU2914670.1 HAMP domain-containing histidine kinase [Reichenbachiella agariperforans]RJE71594.1 histidine kinase [Reichenbachiella sp. MSK19-1]SHK02964.1 Histidine kinase-, DNA gyrase B-, and HSP90-like ATPase [Reichenbachiella agariperforans]
MAILSKSNTSLELYRNRSKFKWVVLVVSIIISLVSIYYTNMLVSQLKNREEKSISLYANTLEYLANQPSNSGINFVFEEIIVSNKSIPVIVTDEIGKPLDSRNIPRADRAQTVKERNSILKEELEIMESQHEPLLVTLRSGDGSITGYQFIYFRNSSLLAQLKYYPVVQLSIIGIFGMIAFLIFNYSKVAEQNRVWVGMAKETAHQLGTPISSLMAWVEYLKTDENLTDKEIIVELEKDVERLNMITSRFSNIGSEPLLENANVYDVINETVLYLKRRLSSKVIFTISCFPNNELEANLNIPLFEWVIENLCKNAVDAMVGDGEINIKILKANEGHVVVDISDTGKGIPKSMFQKIFQPGYSTKKRGWGLGLTLVKRIIDIYHKGKIYVKHSDSKGTTFRISLRS